MGAALYRAGWEKVRRFFIERHGVLQNKTIRQGVNLRLYGQTAITRRIRNIICFKNFPVQFYRTDKRQAIILGGGAEEPLCFKSDSSFVYMYVNNLSSVEVHVLDHFVDFCKCIVVLSMHSLDFILTETFDYTLGVR